jgi:phosphatidylserine/phosphatidylglycerophosphate/cardiolipin synthase-like enzyme
MIRYIPDQEFHSAIMLMLDRAASHIHLSSFFITDELLVNKHGLSALGASLRDASLRGLHCKILLPHSSATRGKIDPSFAAASRLSVLGWQVRRSRPSHKIHAKVCITDSNLLLIGSHNLSVGSLNSNHEASIKTDDVACIYAAESHFLSAWRSSQS